MARVSATRRQITQTSRVTFVLDELLGKSACRSMVVKVQSRVPDGNGVLRLARGKRCCSRTAP
jgi:hypothetical protein